VDLAPPRLVDLVNLQAVVSARPHPRVDSASHHRQQPQRLGSARLAPRRLVSANRRPVSANLNPVVSARSAPRRSNHNQVLAPSVLHNRHRPHPTRRLRKCAVSTELLNITQLVQTLSPKSARALVLTPAHVHAHARCERCPRRQPHSMRSPLERASPPDAARLAARRPTSPYAQP